MSERLTRRVQKLEAQQAQRHAAVAAIARERVLRAALEEFEPRSDLGDLDYAALVRRLSAVLIEEQARGFPHRDCYY